MSRPHYGPFLPTPEQSKIAGATPREHAHARLKNPRAQDLWGLRAEEVVGQALQNLEIGLPVERLKAAVRACIDGRSDAEEVVLDAVNRRGRAIVCRITVAPFRGGGKPASGAVLLMEEVRPDVLEGAEPAGAAAGEANG